MKADRAYIPLEERLVFRKFFREMNEDFSELGFSKAMRKYFDYTKTRIKDPIFKVEDTDRLLDILKNKAVLVIANHNYNAELIPLIGSFPPRDDVYVYALSEIMGMGEPIAEHVIPAYIGKNVIQNSEKTTIRLGRNFRFGPEYTHREAYQKNLESFEKAAAVLKNGSMVIMFPDGIREAHEDWTSGLGRIIALLNDSPEDIYLIKAYAYGTSVFDFLRRIKGIGRILPTMQACIGEPITIQEILSCESHPRKLGRMLQKDYKAWKGSILKT